MGESASYFIEPLDPIGRQRDSLIFDYQTYDEFGPL
jgi:hypothetical protein